MNRHLKLFLALLAGAIAFVPAHVRAQAQAKPAQSKAAAAQAQEEPAEEYTEEEYDAYEKAATKEPDPDKRATLLVEFMDKYPQSKLQPYIVNAYQTLLHEYFQAQKWDKLEPAAERWLKYRPNDLPTVGYIAEAAQRLGHDQKFIDYGLKIFAQKESFVTAYNITQAYKKLGDEAKYQEWTQKLFKYPEFEGDFNSRWMFAKRYADQKKFEKAAEFSQLTLKSLDVAKKPDTVPDTQWRETSNNVRRNCHFIIGMHYYDKDQWPEAIAALNKALRAEKFDAGYYYIGMALWNQKKVEEAMIPFARAELLKGEMRTKAKEKLEQIYKSLHNDTTIGIDKVYRKAAEPDADK